MRTLDSDLLTYYDLVPDDVLKMFAKYECSDWKNYISVGEDFYSNKKEVMDSVDEIPSLTSTELQKICDTIHGEGRAAAFEQFKDVNAEPNESELHMIKNGFERRIPGYDVQFMARSALLLRYGKTFSELSIKNMEKNIINSQKKYGIEDDMKMDLKYKISGIQKKGIRNIIKCRMLLNNYISRMSKNEAVYAKNVILALRNGSGRKIFESRESEMTYVSKLIFGDRFADDDIRDVCNLASIGEIEFLVNERCQKLERNASFNGLVDKIKSIFQKKEPVKYLPEGNSATIGMNEEQTIDEKEAYANSVRVAVPSYAGQSVCNKENKKESPTMDDLYR